MERIAATCAITAGILIIVNLAIDITETNTELPKPLEKANKYTALAAIAFLIAALIAATMA